MDFNTPDSLTGGFSNPSQDRQLNMFAVQTDKLISALTAAVAQLTSKTDAEAARRAIDPDLKLGMAGIARLLTGFDPSSLIRGISTATASMFPTTSGNIAGVNFAGQLMGRGGITDVFAKNVYEHIQRNYFNSLGISDLTKTFGMSRSQMGEVFNVMGQRGMLAGINAGTISMASDGQLKLDTSKRTFEKIDEQFRKTSQVLGAVKKMFGVDGSMVELANIAEQATGVTLGPNGTSAILNRLQTINNFARITGLNTGTAAQIIASSAGSVGEFGRGMANALAIGASRSASMAFRNNQALAAAGQGRGDYFAPKDIQELQATETNLRGQLLKENPLLAESFYILQNVKTLTPDQASQIRSAITQFTNAGTMEEQSKARTALRTAIQSATGRSAGSFTKAMGGLANVLKLLSPETQNELSDILGQNLNNRGVNELSSLAAATNMTGRIFNNRFSSAMMGQAGMAFLGGLSAASQQQLIELLQKGDTAGAIAFLKDKEGVFKEGGLQKGAGVLMDMLRSPNGARRAEMFLREMQLSGSQLDTMKTTVSVEDRRIQQAMEARQKVSGIFDTNLISKPGTFSNILNSILGQTTIDNEDKMRYLLFEGKKGTFETFSSTSMGETAAEAASLSNVLSSYGVDLYKEYGVKKGDSVKLAEAIKNNKNKLFNIMGDKGVTGAAMAGGKVGLAYKDAATKAEKELRLVQEANSNLALMGITQESADYETKLKAETDRLRKEAEDDSKEKDPIKAAQRQTERIKSFRDKYFKAFGITQKGDGQFEFGKSDYLNKVLTEGSAEFETLSKDYKNAEKASLIDSAIQNAIKVAKQNKEAEKASQLEELQKKLKENKSNQYLGILTIKADKSAQIALYGSPIMDDSGVAKAIA
jgi:hypothetical protein